MANLFMDKRTQALVLIDNERNRQIDKWGDQSGNGPFEWVSILGEEYGELCQAVNETCFMNPTHPERGGREQMLKEAVQVAAVAAAIIETLLSMPTAPEKEGGQAHG